MVGSCVGLGNRHPQDIPSVNNGVGQEHFTPAVNGFEEPTVEIIPVFMGKTNKVQWCRGNQVKIIRRTNPFSKLLCDTLEGILYPDDRYVLVQEQDFEVDKQHPRVEIECEVREANG